MQSKPWEFIIQAVSLSLFRVFAVLVLASLWCIPLGLWIGQNPKISYYAEPIIQNLAAFPAPVLFPLCRDYLFP